MLRTLVMMSLVVTAMISQKPLANVNAAEAWSRFQGPVAANADATRLPLEWSPQKNSLWQAELTGYGQSSPVTWEQHVYVTSISGPKKEHGHIAAYQLETGKKLWQYDFDSASQAENNNYVSKGAPTPVVDAGGVIGFFEGGNLLALTHDGNLRWQRNLVDEFGAIESRHGLAASLEHTADRVFVWVERQKEPYVLAVDKQTGRDLWKVAGVRATSWASPRLLPIQGEQHLVLSAIGSLTGLDTATGKTLWRMDGIAGNSTPTPYPAGDGRFLIGATAGRGATDAGKAAASNGLIAVSRSAEGAFHADYVWRAKRATSSFGSPIVHKGKAYFVNATGVLFCLDLETGEELYSNRLAESVWATPLALSDRICFFGKGGKVSIVSAGSEFEKLAENEVWEQPTEVPVEGTQPDRSAPVLYAAVYVQDRLLLRRGDRLYCIGATAP